jgi:predicted transcriptional regulator
MPELAEFVYVDTALGALNRRNHVRRLTDLDLKEGGAERYISHRRATEALLEWTRTHTNANGQPTIEGFDGAVWDPSLPFDFDDRYDPAHALVWMRQFLDRLEREDVPLDALRVYFSGAKGFHVEIPHTLFGGFEPSDQLHVWERAAALELMNGIPFDSAVYDKLRLWRLPNTLNAKGQRYKVQLSLQEVRGLSMAEILALAEAPRPRLPAAPLEEWTANEYLIEVWTRARGVGDRVVLDQSEPRTWSDDRRSEVVMVAVAAVVASNWPTDPGISRHSDYLLPLSGFLARHMDAASAAELLKDAARQSGDQGFLNDRQRHWEEEIDRLAEGSAAKIANHQPVEGLPTIDKRWPELAEFLSTMFVVTAGKGAAARNGHEPHGFLFTSMEDLLAEPPESVAYLVEGMLPTGGVSLWGAKPKVGKSVAVRNLAISVARGEAFLERACHRGAVVVLALEEKRAEVANHFRNMGGTNELIHVHVGAAPGTSKEGMAALANAIALFQPVLVIADPVLKLVRVRDSSDYAELTRELEPVIELARRTGCHIAVTHHLGKMTREGGDDVLGSTAIFGAVDTLVLFRRRKDNLRVLQTIQRYGADLGETVVPMDELGRIALGAAVSELRQAEVRAKVREVLEKLGEGESLDLTALREQTEMDRNSVHRAAQQLADEGVVERIGEGRRGNPWRYLMAGQDSEKTVLLYSSTSKAIQQYSKSETLSEIVGAEKATTGELFPGQAPVDAAVSRETVLLYSPTSKAIQQYSKSETEEGLCRACGKPLGEVEAGVSLQLHWDCTLPMTATP